MMIGATQQLPFIPLGTLKRMAEIRDSLPREWQRWAYVIGEKLRRELGSSEAQSDFLATAWTLTYVTGKGDGGEVRAAIERELPEMAEVIERAFGGGVMAQAFGVQSGGQEGKRNAGIDSHHPDRHARAIPLPYLPLRWRLSGE